MESNQESVYQSQNLSHQINMPTTWQGYRSDTQQFDVTTFNPYQNKTVSHPPVCSAIPGLPGSLNPFTFVEYKDTGSFVLFSGDSHVSSYPLCKNYNFAEVYSVSKTNTLLQWNPPHLLACVNRNTDAKQSAYVRYNYPSIVDITQKDPNFSHMGDAPFLLLTQFPANIPPSDRKIIAIPLTVSTGKTNNDMVVTMKTHSGHA